VGGREDVKDIKEAGARRSLDGPGGKGFELEYREGVYTYSNITHKGLFL